MTTLDERATMARAREILNRHPAVGMAVGVVRKGRLESFYGHGLADIVSKTPITEDTVFRIASITKTFTAIAIMQLWEQGFLDLDAPANDYLRAFRLIPARAGFRPATVRHLLTHTAGVADRVDRFGLVHPDSVGRVDTGQPLPTLTEYYRDGLRVVSEPGTNYVYSDDGFAALGQIVEDVSGTPLDRYLRERIFEPLGMVNSDLLRSERVRPYLATGYSLRPRGPKPVADYEWVTAAAASIYSTPQDMARYLAALLGGGANDHGSVLKPTTMATMFEPHFQPDPRLAGMGLGFVRAILGGHLALEHSGNIPGFSSHICLAPDDGVGVMVFTNGASRPGMWLASEADGMLRQLLGVPDDLIRADIPQHPEVWGELCGRYRLAAAPTGLRSRAAAGLGAEVLVQRGKLVLRYLSPIPGQYRGFPLHPDDETDPYAFRIDRTRIGAGTARVVFSRAPREGTMRVYSDIPSLSLQKPPATTNPGAWRVGALGGLAVLAAVGAIRRRSRL